VAAEAVFVIAAGHRTDMWRVDLEETAASAVVRVPKGAGLLAYHVVGTVGDLFAAQVPWNKRRGRSGGDGERRYS
jgi:hypothetical protein